MAAAMSLRIALAIILVPVVAASSGGDAVSNSLFAGISPLLGLFGQNFATQYLSQSTSPLDTIVFAMGPLGIPAAITAVIRVSGYRFLKGAIGRAGEKESSIEGDLLSSTSEKVCELWDGEKVVRLEAEEAPIRELVYCRGEWYNLREAEKKGILAKSKDSKVKDNDKNPKDANTKKRKSRLSDVESPQVSEDPLKSNDNEQNTSTAGTVMRPDLYPPNLLLNLVHDDRSWELPAAATLGILLQLTVLIIAGLTTFYPPWKGKFSVLQYEFYCMTGGTVLLTFGLIICASVIDQRTIEETYKSKGDPVQIIWLQRGRSNKDQSFKPHMFGIKQQVIRTSRLPRISPLPVAEPLGPFTEGIRTSHLPVARPSATLEAWTLVGIVATTLGFISQFIGLVGMHWPTQAAQFAVTLIMTGVRAFIRRAPPTPPLQAATQPLLREKIPDNHEMDWLATKFGEVPCEDKREDVWQMITVETLSEFRNPSDTDLLEAGHLFACIEDIFNRPINPSELSAYPGTPQYMLEMEQLKWERESQSLWAGQNLLKRRGRLGALCGWTGPARTCAISVATAIDEVMNILPGLKDQDASNHPRLQWPLDVLVYGTKRRIWFTISYVENRWKSDFTEIEAALSLGLFGVQRKTLQEENSGNLNSGEDWLRLDEKKATVRRNSVRLLGPSTTASRRDLLWWCGPGTGKLKTLVLHKVGNSSKIVGVDRVTGPGYNNILAIEQHRIAGFQGEWIVELRIPASHCIAAVSKGDLGLLYAQHMFSAFMWTIAKDVEEFADARIGETCKFDPKEKKSWESLELKNNTVLELAQCVQRAGLGDMEDAYLSIIPPLSNEGKLPRPVEVFNIARNNALEEQRRGNWENACKTYRLLFHNFVIFGIRDHMSIKATALLTEFFMLLSAKPTLWKGRVLEEDESEDTKLGELKQQVLEDLMKADGDVMHNLKTLYKRQGRSEDCEELPVKDKADTSKLKELREFLGQGDLHFAAMDMSYSALEGFLLKNDKDKLLKKADFFHRTALHYAACKKEQSRGEIYKQLLQIVGNRDAEDCYGMTALLTAAERGNAEIVEVLLEDGASKDGKFQNWTALHIAAAEGHLGVVEKLMDFGADTAVNTSGGRTALHLAVLGCYGSVIFKLLERDFDAADATGRTALHLAAQSNLVEERLEKEREGNEQRESRRGREGEGEGEGEEEGEEENEEVEATKWVLKLITISGKETDRNGKTALHLAAECGHKRMVSLLLKHTSLIQIPDLVQRTALHLAAERGQKTVVELLLRNQAKIDEKDKYGKMALHLAAENAENGREEVVRLLLEKMNEDQIATPDDDGLTALDWAVNNGHEKAVRLLLHAVVDTKTALYLEAMDVVTATDKYGQTALHLAARDGHESWVKLLLKMGAEVAAKDNEGQTALHLASRNGHEGIVWHLLKSGAEVAAEDKEGQTALHLASKNGHEGLVRYLQEWRPEVAAEDNKEQRVRGPADVLAERALRNAVYGPKPPLIDYLI